MEYTIQLPIMVTFVVKADTMEEALDDVADAVKNSDGFEYLTDMTEAWDDVQVFDEEGNLIDEEIENV